jgi:hypothetical protein
LVLIGVIIVSYFTIVAVRRWSRQEDAHPPGGFSLTDLKQMHRSGQLTVEEYERARAMIVARTKQAAEEQKPEKEKPH